MEKIKIDTLEEYNYLVSRNYEPLLEFDFRIKAQFLIDNQLRRDIQKEKFKTMDKFYRYCFEHSNQICEETGLKIYQYSAVHISHILTRGAHPAISKDPRNFNILTLQAHNTWEFGNRFLMKIYQKNQDLAERLKLEYYGKTQR